MSFALYLRMLEFVPLSVYCKDGTTEIGQNFEGFRYLDSLLALLAEDAQVKSFSAEFTTRTLGCPPCRT
jgi:hypothetical protein